MKKMLLVMTALVCVLALAGCSCEHEWAEANCTAAKTCKLCKENGADVLVAGSAFYKAADRAALTKIIEA